MGCADSTTYKEIHSYVSKDVVKTLNDRSDKLLKQLINSKFVSNKLAKLIEIILKQNLFFNRQLQSLFQKFIIKVPQKFVQVNNQISQDLKYQFQQFQKQYSAKTKQIIQLNQTINILNQKVIYLQKLKISKQEPKFSLRSPSREQDELDRLNRAILKHQQNEQEFKAKIKDLEKALQTWRQDSVRLSQLNSELQSNNLRRSSSFFKKNQDESIKQLRQQKLRLQDNIKEYKILLKQKLDIEKQYKSKIQAWRLNDEERKNNQQFYKSYLNQRDSEISNLKVQIQNLQSDKQKLERQLQGIKRLESNSQNEITKLKTQISLTEGERNRINFQVESLRRNQQEILKKSNILASQYQQTEQNNAEAETKLLDLKARQKISNEKVQKMQQRINQLEKEIINLTTKYNSEIKSLSSTNLQQTEQLQIQLCLQKSQNESIKQQYSQKVKNLQEKINELQQSINTAQSKTSSELTETPSPQPSLQFDHEQYEENLNNYKEKLQDSKWEIDQLKSKVESQSILLAAAQRQVVTPKPVQLQSLPKDLALINQLGQKKLALQAKIKQNEVLLLSFTKKISILQAQNLKLQSQAKASQINLANLKTQLQRKSLSLKDSQQLLKTREQQLLKKQSQILQKQQTLREQQQRVILDKNQTEFQKSQLKSKVDQLQKLQNDLKIKQYRLGSSDNLRQDYESQLIQKNTTITEMKLKVNTLENQLTSNKQYMEEILVNLRQMQQASKQSKQRQQHNKQLFQRISKQLQLKNAELQKAIIQIQKSASDSNDNQAQNQRLRQRIVLLSDQVANQKNQKTTIINALNDEVDKRQKREKQIQILKERLNVLDKNNIGLIEQVKEIKKVNLNAGRCFSQYFNGHILNIDTEEDIKWIVDSIEKYMGKQIRSTRILCRMDPQNKNNLHNYIDFVPNIVFVGRMENGQTIIAFSEPEFKRPLGKIDYRPGMILALRNRRIFTVKRQKTNKLNKTDPKPIDWDEYYVIWGNADLRIRMNDTEFYSNYSTTNCAYEERANQNKASIADMFEGDDRLTKLLNYEFYQINFEQNSQF